MRHRLRAVTVIALVVIALWIIIAAVHYAGEWLSGS
jgi:hypothetical protein